jgi:hypothetical protein
MTLSRSLFLRTALWCAILLTALVMMRVVACRFYWDQTVLPAGCDSFGYAMQAEAIRQGREFGDHTPRPFLAPLAQDLSGISKNPNDWVWPIAPHAYRYDPQVGRLVNQYPPGTSLFLAPFPREIRSLVFPVLIAASLLCLLALFRRDDGALLATRAGCLLVLVACGFYFEPFSREYRSLNSVAPCFALLVAAGWFLPVRPLLSVGLLSAGVLLRIPNAWLLPVAALPVLFPEWFSGKPFAGLRPVVPRGAKVILTAFFCGVLWLLLFQYLTMGSAFRTTYPYYDRNAATPGGMLENLRYYFSLETGWMWVHVVVLFLAGAVFCRRGTRRWFLLVLFLFLWNYGFYVTHDVRVSYYPFASSVLALGLVLRGMENLPRRVLQVSSAAVGLLVILALIGAWRSVPENPTEPVAAKIAAIQKAFAGADAVWAEHRSGTVEYAAGIPGMRILWGSREVRAEAVRWLRAQGYRQAVLIDDIGMNESEARAVLEMAKVPVRTVEDETFGRILWIDPETPAQ